MIIEYGTPIQKAAQDAQENVRKAIESMTGLHVVRVDVHVQGVSFEKENSTGTLTAGSDNAVLEAGDAPRDDVPAEQPVRESEPVADAPAADEEKPEA